MRIAVIDDDSAFLQVLENRLGSAGWEYRVLRGPVPAEEMVAMRLQALVVDPATVGEDAFAFVERTAAAMPGLGIVVCTGPSSVAQRVRGLRMGADDWITKPCHPEEVMARVEAVARRRKRAAIRTDVGPLVAGEVEVRFDQYQAFVAGRSMELTRREFELLQALVEEQGRVVQREDIYQRVWGYAMAHGDRSVDVFIRKLRHKLEVASPGWSYIHTHFGIGYRFDPEPATGSEPPARPIAPVAEADPADAARTR